MKPYADYDFYANEYSGREIPREIYEKAALNASQYIRYITLGRSDNYAGEEMKYAACAAAETYVEVYGLTGSKASVGQIKSENTDGYSVSYVIQTKDGESKEELFKRKAYEIISQWLQGTGLLNRRVECCHVNKCGLHNL